MQHALWSAWREGWHSFVIVSHSFELIQPAQDGGLSSPRRQVISRFENLCQFLDENRDCFQTAGFNKLGAAEFSSLQKREPIRGSLIRTAQRHIEQAIGRVI